MQQVVTPAQLDALLADIGALVARSRHPFAQPGTVSTERGARYLAIRVHWGAGSSAIYGYVDLATGDLLAPTGYDRPRPAPTPLGNLFDRADPAGPGRSCLGPSAIRDVRWMRWNVPGLVERLSAARPARPAAPVRPAPVPRRAHDRARLAGVRWIGAAGAAFSPWHLVDRRQRDWPVIDLLCGIYSSGDEWLVVEWRDPAPRRAMTDECPACLRANREPDAA